MTLLLADDRSYLYVEHPVRWALGDPAVPALTLNDADAHGCAWLVGDVDGWDAPTVDLPMDRRPDGHGGFAGIPTYEARPLSVEGTVTAPSYAELAAAKTRLTSALLGHLGQAWRWTALDESPPRGLWVYPTGKPLWRWLSDRAADFSFVVVAEDPIKTAEPVTYGPVRLTGTASEGGYVMGAGGATAPWTASGSATAGSVVARVRNEGDEDAHALYRITGPVPEPVVQLGSGEFVHLRLDLSALDTAEVDTYTGAVTVNGVNRYDAWGPGSVFPLIPADSTTDVRLRSITGGADPAAALTIITAPSWR